MGEEAGDGEAVGVSDGVGGAEDAALGSTDATGTVAVGLGDVGAVPAHATTTSPAISRIARRDFERTVTPI